MYCALCSTHCFYNCVANVILLSASALTLPPPPLLVSNLKRWYFKLLLALGLLLALVSAAINLVIVPLLNVEAVPTWADKAQAALCRKAGFGEGGVS